MRRLNSAIALVVTLAVSTTAYAQKTDEARSRFGRGVELFKDGDYRAALIEFKRAYELAPNYKVLYNLGQTSLELQDYASALKTFEQYLREGGKDVSSKRRAEVEAELGKLRTRVAKITVEANVEGAEVTIDDIVVGKTPLTEPLTVSAGRRKISVSKSGLTTATRTIDIAGGDNQKVPLELVDPQAAVVTTTNPSTDNPDVPRAPTQPITVFEPAKTNKNMTPVWIGVGVTGGLAVGTIVFGIVALSAKSTFDTRVGELGQTTQSIDDARSRTRTFALVTDIFGGATIIAGGVTLALALTRPTRTKEAFARPYFSPFGGGVAGAF